MRGWVPAAIVFLLSGSVFASFTPAESGKILFCIHRGKEPLAIDQYLKCASLHEKHDFELLRKMGILLLQRGATSDDPELALMTLFGAGAALRPSLIHILEKGITTLDQRLQLLSLQFLTRLQEDRADLLIERALTSPFLLTRLEAALYLAKKGEKTVMPHIESLLGKVPSEVKALLPQILVYLEEARAKKMLGNFLRDPNQMVRIQTLLQIGQAGRDDFLSQIRPLTSSRNPIEQQSIITALAALKDHRSLPYFYQLAESEHLEVRLTALGALVRLGETTLLDDIVQLAKDQNLFAIALLGQLKQGGKEVLTALSQSHDLEVRINASLSRLALKDASVVDQLEEILLTKNTDLGFYQRFSSGGSLRAWKVLSSAHQRLKLRPTLLGTTIALKESVLRGALELPEPHFLNVARLVFDHRQFDLVPLLTELLINHQSDATIALLKEYSQGAGIPLIRNYCNLALYRLRVEGPYEKNLKNWVEKSFKTALISFREEREAKPSADMALTPTTLTPQESSALLISAFEAFASAQNEGGIEMLLNAIAHGNPKNRYALAGLLIRTTE